MDHTDLDQYLAAKRGQKAAIYITVLGLIVAVGAGIFLALGISPSISKAILIGSAVGVLLANSEFGLYGTVVSRLALLSIIEKQINRDPNAIAYLAKKSLASRRVA
jgi:hypothetical protein